MFRSIFCIAWSVVCYLGVHVSRLIASVGEERAGFLLLITSIFVIYVRRSSYSSECLGKAA